MAENDQPQDDRTEPPSPKKLADAKQKGRVPRSKELGMTAVMLVGSASLLLMRPIFGTGLDSLLSNGLTIHRSQAMSRLDPMAVFFGAVQLCIGFMWPLLVVLIAAALAGTLVMGGWTFSAEQLAPKLEKLDPIKGIKRVFGWTGLSELGKALFKFLIVACSAVALIWYLSPQIMRLGSLGIGSALSRTAWLTSISFVGFSAALLLIAAYDVPFQLWQFRRQMRMTKQEQKDEQKETEGRPEVRQRIRQAQHDIATRRMLADVQNADVVTTNPQHYAVAIRYDAKDMRAPKVLARGTDQLALTIRRIAQAHGIPIFEHPPLARALYHTTDVGQEISPRLYFAVAQVLTYVFQLTGRMPAGPSGQPVRPNPDIEDDLLVPARERRRAQRTLST